jgi:DNA-binding Xre family transcriptional regulator
MNISYEKLWKLLKINKMCKRDLAKAAGISSYTMTRLNNNMPVHMSVMIKFCKIFHCDIGDIVEIIAENSNVLISFPTVICGDGDAGRVYDAVKEAMDSLTGGKKGISAGTTVWCYERPEYEKCLSVLCSRSFVTKTELQRFSPKYYGAISFKGGVINVNRDDFIREAGK